jgi:hypothetical protein
LFLEKALELMVTVGASDGLVKESCGKLFTGAITPIACITDFVPGGGAMEAGL